MFGGTQSLHTNALDEAIALPTEFSARIARNTQLIIQEETHITSVIDPGAQLRRWKLAGGTGRQSLGASSREVNAGGMTKAVGSGCQAQIEASGAEAGAHRLRGDVVVGSKVPGPDHPVQILEIDNVKVREAQIERLKHIKTDATMPPS